MLIAVLGPTASGKTSLAIDLAKMLNTEIVSCDSRQFYHQLAIGSAPPTKEELASAKHHFIGHLNLEEEFNAGQFERAAVPLIENLNTQKDNVVMVGGSGMYARAVFEGFDPLPKADPSIRKELEDLLNEQGISILQEELKTRDPQFYQTIDLQNPQRLIRALEVIRATGKPYSLQRKNKPKTRNFKIVKIGLNPDRDWLYKRINKRVDLMVEAGLVEEAKACLPFRQFNALQTVGYKELFDFFDGHTDLETAINLIKQNSRRYAKRQLTWLRKESEINWFDPLSQKEEILDFVRTKCQS